MSLHLLACACAHAVPLHEADDDPKRQARRRTLDRFALTARTRDIPWVFEADAHAPRFGEASGYSADGPAKIDPPSGLNESSPSPDAPTGLGA